METALVRRVLNAPNRPGVYTFRDRDGRILYIGKAANLRARLRSYFVESADLSPAKQTLLREASRVSWQETENDIAALILEAQLIKKQRPKYNVLLRDDKNYFFVGFTKETFPRIFLTHQPKTRTSFSQRPLRETHGVRGKTTTNPPDVEFIGPFTDGRAIKRTLRLLRRLFPYATHKGFPNRCLEYDLGLCPIPPGDPETWNMEHETFTRLYRRNIRAIQEVLTGKRQTLLKRLEREMQAAARQGDFELAAVRRDEIRGLERIFAHRTVIAAASHTLTWADIPEPIRRSLKSDTALLRIEGYDIANLAGGRAATGSLVTFRCTSLNGSHASPSRRSFLCEPERSGYRHFRIKTVRGANDVAMIREVLNRRILHDEWPMPNLILIDGGKPQLNAAREVLEAHFPSQKEARKRRPNRSSSMPFVLALAKRQEEIYLPGRTMPLRLPKDHLFLNLLMHLRDEAHRFARRYHHHLRSLTR
jgi:excinuclease ABC subunit C